MNREQELLKVLQQNECILQIVAWEDLVNEWKITSESVKIASGYVTKDSLKLASGYVSPAQDVATAIKLIRDVGGFTVNQVRITTVNGKKYVVFKGYPGQRNILTGTRYLTTSPKIIRMAVGPESIKNSAKGGFILTVILSVGIEIFSYISSKDKSSISTLLGTITGDVMKIGLSTIAGWAAAIAIGSVSVISGIAAGPFIVAIAVGVVTGIALDAIDSKFGATQALINAYERAGIKLKEIETSAARSLKEIETSAARSYWQLEQAIICRYAPIACRGY